MGYKGRPWTEEEDACVRAIPHHSRDGTYARLMREFGRTYGAIATRHRRLHPPLARQRAWTDEEHVELVRLKTSGLKWREIGDRLSRTAHAVETRWRRLQGLNLP